MSTGSNQGSPISVQCPKCAAKLRATAELVGKRIACPKCGSRVLIPHLGGGQGGAKLGASSQDEDWFSLEPLSSTQPSGTRSNPSDKGSLNEDSFTEDLLQGGWDDGSNEAQESTSAEGSDIGLSAEESPPLGSQSGSLQRSVFDDDLPDLTPFDEPQAPAPNPKSRREDDLLRSYLGGEVKPSPGERKGPSGKATSNLGGTQGGIDGGSAGGEKVVDAGQDGEYSVVCKVCGTVLYVRPSRIGKQIRCPDCHSEFPQPAPKPQKKPTETRWDERDASVQLAPAEGASPRVGSRETTNTKSILDKAAEELKREAEELDGVSGTFDTEAWLAMVFGFLSDRSLVIAIAVLSLFAGIFGYVFHALGPYVLDQEYWHIQLLRLLMIVLGFIPILCAVMLCCLAIIPKAANRLIKVEEWPFGKLGDSFGELMMLFIAVAGTYAIGLPIGSALLKMRAPFLIYGSMPMLGLWGLLPIVLLSMIESGNLFPPVTLSIFKSLSQKPDAWGAMYMQTGVALAIFFVLSQVAFLYGPIAVAILFFLFPWIFCFVANQYGTLAGRISDVTELGFEGEFEEEEE